LSYNDTVEPDYVVSLIAFFLGTFLLLTGIFRPEEMMHSMPFFINPKFFQHLLAVEILQVL
jgi:hypothetical protein